ncbi:MAG: glycoside hydrolase family 3 protein [Treponemataceae bacterium]|nr:glycoside hydrolase family 3 protein [Treponemataceae bacterium]
MSRGAAFFRILCAVLLSCTAAARLSAQQDSYADAAAQLPADITFWSTHPDEQLARALVGRMSDEEILAQIFMFGWAGAEPESLLFQWVGGRGLGSVKVFGWNTDDIKLVAKSIAALQKSAAGRAFKIPLFVATDQEGGWIRHVKGETAVTPGNMAIGAAGYPADAWYSGYYICREIKALGINMNFAPTVDLFTNQDSTIIGTRSFGENPEKAGILGGAFAAGSSAAGVIPTAKHFPGHGDTDSDSHINLPVIDIDFGTFRSRELVPFEYLIREKIPAVMSGHLAFPQIDPTGAPASLSKYFLTELLRGQMGYDGLIITDDMMMNGDTLYAGSLSSAFRMAIEAGNDIVISSTTARLNEALWTNNLALIRSDPAFKARVQDAAYRVIRAKLAYFKGGNSAPLYPDPDAIGRSIPDRDGRRFFLEQACRSITVYKQTALPLSAESAGKVLFAGALPEFFTEGRKRYPNSIEFRFSYELGPNETEWMRDNILNTASACDTVIFCVSSARSAQIAQKLRGTGKRVVILSIMSPANAFGLDWADEILLGYSWSGYTFAALFGALGGEFQTNGTMPFTAR